MESPVFLGSIPPDLLSRIVEISDRPLQTYIQLLSLSHVVRLAIRGTPRELSFNRKPGHGSPKPTADALAALLGPCKDLAKLSFRPSDSSLDPTVYDCGRTEAACAGWVDEAFGGHDRLAVLEYLPTTCEPVIERILLRLPGLVALRLGSGTPIRTDLLAAIARSCPLLQTLRSDSNDTRLNKDPDLTALAPLAGSLQDFRIRTPVLPARLDAFMSSLTAVTTLHLQSCRPAALEPLAAHLTRLSIEHVAWGDDGEVSLPGPWLARLERLSLGGCRTFTAPLARLLAANQTTLRRLKLAILRPDADELAPLMAALDGLPQLTHLELICPSEADLTGLPPALLGRLVSLTLGMMAVLPLRIASDRLRRLRFPMGQVESLTVDCPALVELRLPEIIQPQLSIKCPRLRLIEDLPAWYEGFSGPMADLERLVATRMDSVWLADLLAGSPRLRTLPLVNLTTRRPDLLALLCASGSLVEMGIELEDDDGGGGGGGGGAAMSSNPLVLRLPGQLASMNVSLEGATTSEVQVEAPGLRHLAIDGSITTMRLSCPSLATLSVQPPKGWADPTHRITSIELDVSAQPRSLTIWAGCQPASLLGLLARNGARLHHVDLSAALETSVWPQVAAALGMLPRLTHLRLDITNAPSPLSLTCPQLRILELHGVSKECKVMLACPLLEVLSGCADPSGQVELTAPAPNLPPLEQLVSVLWGV
ncbi:hypothetical protein PAPYR_574 [Paratrimastix pyriformis]|uniref:Uncharacterized protein n=1 Tax=Paratrimastix pyriformis TaxID=342808 RepID=A0ABQ8UYD8_9EUKA|nr:hypothetical protein PAPYR_574 [Paratrimastix pyriformis]